MFDNGSIVALPPREQLVWNRLVPPSPHLSMPTAGKLGFRVLPAPPRLDDDARRALSRTGQSNLADAMGRFGFMDPGIQSRSKLPLCGLAVTVLCAARRQPHGPQGARSRRAGRHRRRRTRAATLTSAVFGELMCHTAAAKKLGGIIVDGAIRDVDGITRARLPRVQPQRVPRRLRQGRAGRDQRADRLRRHVVMPGDIVVGDDDGVAVVPRERRARCSTSSSALMARENGAHRRDQERRAVQGRDRRGAAKEGGDRLVADAPLRVLMTPGPTRVPDRVLRAGARPMIHHRTPEFSRELADDRSSCSGRRVRHERPSRCRCTPPAAARSRRRSAICSRPATRSRSCCNGKFGEMWAGFAESYGLRVHRFATDWEHDADSVELEIAARAHPTSARRDRRLRRHVDRRRERRRRHRSGRDARTARSRSSTPCRRSAACRSRSTSGASTSPSPRRRSVSMSSPGLAWVAMSDRAWTATEHVDAARATTGIFAPSSDSISKPKPETPGTTPVHLVLQVRRSAADDPRGGRRTASGRGITAMAERARTTGRTRSDSRCSARRTSRRSATLTAIALPRWHRAQAVARYASRRAACSPRRASARTQADGFRIGHMGDIRLADVDRTLDALRDALRGARAVTR